MIKKMLLMACAISFNSIAYSANTTVTAFELWSSNYAETGARILLTSGTIINPSGCANADSYFVSTTLSVALQNRIYSTLLMAKALDRTVTL